MIEEFFGYANNMVKAGGCSYPVIVKKKGTELANDYAKLMAVYFDGTNTDIPESDYPCIAAEALQGYGPVGEYHTFLMSDIEEVMPEGYYIDLMRDNTLYGRTITGRRVKYGDSDTVRVYLKANGSGSGRSRNVDSGSSYYDDTADAEDEEDDRYEDEEDDRYENEEDDRDDDEERESSRSRKVAAASAQQTFTPNGSWRWDGTSWRFDKTEGGNPVDTWYQCTSTTSQNWYHFDANGAMQTGWLTDKDGNTYYLSEAQDAEIGVMSSGWKWISGKCYYFNTAAGVNGLPYGALYRNTTTPDGHTVNEAGEWVMNGAAQANGQ